MMEQHIEHQLFRLIAVLSHGHCPELLCGNFSLFGKTANKPESGD